MATITSKVYDSLLFGLAGSEHTVFYDAHKLLLLAPAYTPDYTGHARLADIQTWEIAGNDSSYYTGGLELQNQNTNYSPGSWAMMADPMAITGPLDSFRYGVIYKAAADNPLMVCIDFGETLSFTDTEEFDVDFGTGFLNLKAS